MSTFWNRLTTWLDHPGVRIEAPDGEPNTEALVRILALFDELAETANSKTAPEPAAPAPPSPVVPAASAPPKSLTTDLCNRLHAMTRAVARAREKGMPEADRLNTQLDRLNRTLSEHSITWEDLTGQGYEAGRADFDPLGPAQ